MKKTMLICLTVLVSIMAFGVTDVKAYTKADLREKLVKKYVINGSEFKADDDQIVELDRYLRVNGLSDEDAKYIADKMDEAIALIEAGNAKEWKQLTSSEKEKLVAMVADISNHTSVKATLTKGGVLTIYNSDGTVFTKLSDLIKYTDNSKTILLITGLISLFGLVVFATKFNKVNA